MSCAPQNHFKINWFRSATKCKMDGYPSFVLSNRNFLTSTLDLFRSRRYQETRTSGPLSFISTLLQNNTTLKPENRESHTTKDTTDTKRAVLQTNNQAIQWKNREQGFKEKKKKIQTYLKKVKTTILILEQKRKDIFLEYYLLLYLQKLGCTRLPVCTLKKQPIW